MLALCRLSEPPGGLQAGITDSGFYTPDSQDQVQTGLLLVPALKPGEHAAQALSPCLCVWTVQWGKRDWSSANTGPEAVV